MSDRKQTTHQHLDRAARNLAEAQRQMRVAQVAHEAASLKLRVAIFETEQAYLEVCKP